MQNNQSAEGMVFLFVIAIGWLLLQIIFALMLAVGIILGTVITIVCLLAWNRPLALFGEVLTPQEARAFVLGGIGCAVAAMFVFALAEAIGLPFPLSDRFYAVTALAAYLFGGAGCVEAAEQMQKEATARALQGRQEILKPLAPPPAHVPPPFDYAVWNDEDEFRR